jgi:UDP-N-acetyl-D-glucosamine dehydrogenase
MNRLEELEARIRRQEAEIAIVGLGYVGLPMALAFAEAGFHVTGIDNNAERVRSLNDGRSYVDDIADLELEKALHSGRFEATTEVSVLARTDCINICVPTPLSKTREPDLSFIIDAVEELRRYLRSGHLVVLGSTTYPGTTHDLYRPILEGSGLRVGREFCLAFAPERIDPGNKKFGFRNVPKVVGGETPLCTRLASRMFESVVDTIVPVSNSQTAEMVKLLENTFRMINIGLANEMAMICDRLRLDVWEVIEAAATKPYGFMKFLPGPGLGGHCIPVDPKYLAWKLRAMDFAPRFIELASDVNSGMPAWVLQRVMRALNNDRKSVNGANILLLGVAYKANIADLRESPALDILAQLEQLGAQVSYHDPHVAGFEVDGRRHESQPLTEGLLARADLVLIATDHGGIDYDFVVRHARRILDTRNATAGSATAAHVERL